MAYFFFACVISLTAIFIYFLHHRSITDELTHLKNRRALYAKYGNKGIKPKIRLIYLDINSFKPINDTYGHNVGDMILTTFAQRIKAHWKGDAYRIGGDEFILIGSYPKEDKLALVKKIIGFTVPVKGKKLTVNSSFGFYSSETETVTLDEALHQADIAMYENKKMCYEQQHETAERRKE